MEAQQVAAYLPILKIAVAGAMAAYGLYLLRGEFREPAPGTPLERPAGA